MKQNNLKANLLIVCSFVFFLFASAFTMMPEPSEVDVLFNNCSSECCTCDPQDMSQCSDASYCGMDSGCWAGPIVCQRAGDLCGECGDEEG